MISMQSLILRSLSFICVCLTVANGNSATCGHDVTIPVVLRPMPSDFFAPERVILRLAGDHKTTVYIRDTKYKNAKASSTVLKTQDGGDTWQSLPADLGNDSKPQEELWSDDQSVVYRKRGPLYLRSFDKGLHWELPKYLIDGKATEQFAAKYAKDSRGHLSLSIVGTDPKDARRIFGSFNVSMASEKEVSQSQRIPGVYVSLDAGDNWVLFSGELVNGSPVRISTSAPNIVWGVSETGPVRSDNGGKTWRAVGQQAELMRPLFPIDEAKVNAAADAAGGSQEEFRRRATENAKSQVWDIALYQQDSSYVLMLMNKGLFQSVDGGDSWHYLDIGSNMIGIINSASYDLTDPRTIYVGAVDLVKSIDGGCTFRRVYPPHSSHLPHHK